jgi:hypothetical protein
MKKPFVFRTYNGKVRYEVLLKKPPKTYKAVGLCFDPTEESPKIIVNPHQTERQLMNTIIHEFAHAFFWDSSEQNVTKFGNIVTRYLYSQGWKKAKPNKKKKK